MLKGKINEGGCLEIMRGGELQKQDCPFNRDWFCSTSCPHFGEPYRSPGHGSPWYLLICQCRTLVFESLVDERQKGGG